MVRPVDLAVSRQLTSLSWGSRARPEAAACAAKQAGPGEDRGAAHP